MENIEIKGSHAHGHVKAVLAAIDKLGIRDLISPITTCYYSDLLIAMLVSRILWPESKFHSSQSWKFSSLDEVLHIKDANDDDFYEAMDWFYEQRLEIVETELIDRHKKPADPAILYLSQCDFIEDQYLETHEGGAIEIEESIFYVVLTDHLGCPYYITYFKGDQLNTRVLLSTVARLREQYRFPSFLLVMDENLISQKKFNILKEKLNANKLAVDVSWIAALSYAEIKKLVDNQQINPSTLEENKPLMIQHADFDNEKLVAHRNQKLAIRYQKDRESLLKITSDKLNELKRKVEQGRLNDDVRISSSADRVIKKYKMTGCFNKEIYDNEFHFSIKQAKVDENKALDGLSLIRIFSNHTTLLPEYAVRHYVRHQRIKGKFQPVRILKLEKLREERIKTHLCICLLANYVRWHMEKAWKPLLSLKKDSLINVNKPADSIDINEQELNTPRLNVSKKLNFQLLLSSLATITRYSHENQNGAANGDPIIVDAQYTPMQSEAFNLLKKIKKYR